jgi:hypothetical protein
MQILGNVKNMFIQIVNKIKGSRLAQVLLMVIFIKFLIFYGFFKGYLAPKLRPKYDSPEHRTEEVIKHITNPIKPTNYD